MNSCMQAVVEFQVFLRIHVCAKNLCGSANKKSTWFVCNMFVLTQSGCVFIRTCTCMRKLNKSGGEKVLKMTKHDLLREFLYLHASLSGALSRNSHCWFVVLLIDVKAVSVGSHTQPIKWNRQTSPDSRLLPWAYKVVKNRYFLEINKEFHFQWHFIQRVTLIGPVKPLEDVRIRTGAELGGGNWVQE